MYFARECGVRKKFGTYNLPPQVPILLIGETFCTVLLFTLDEQYFLYIKITIIIFLRQGILILPFLMKFDLGEIYFIKETRTRNLISKKMQTFLANISWHKNW